MSKENRRINRDVFEGKWKEIQGQARERWGSLTGDGLETMEGQAEQLVGRIQQKYGYANEAKNVRATRAGSQNDTTRT